MPKVLFKRKTSTEIEELPIEDGSFIIDIEKGKSYTDVGETRIPVGSAGNEISISATEPTNEDTKIWINPNAILPQEQTDSLTSEIIENENGKAIKYSDGTMVCMKTISGESTFTQTGNLYYKTVDFGNWACPFTKIDNAFTTVIGLAIFSGNIDNFTVTSGGSTRLYKTNADSISYSVQVIGFGKWKQGDLDEI